MLIFGTFEDKHSIAVETCTSAIYHVGRRFYRIDEVQVSLLSLTYIFWFMKEEKSKQGAASQFVAPVRVAGDYIQNC